jgi:PKD repeat protein
VQIHFRQGIVRYQTDVNAQATFLQKSSLDSRYVDLIVSPDPTIIAFAQRNANYVFEEARTVSKAWGPFGDTTTQYLYWDINVLTAQLTRGSTTLPPVVAGTSPNNPITDQHWFDTTEVLMKVWNGSRWIEKIRVFAAVYSSSAIIRPYPRGTQVGLNTPVDAGNIILDGFFKPLRQSDGSFLTSTADMSVVGIATKKIRVEAETLQLLAQEFVPIYSCVQARPGRTCALGHSSDRMSRVIGIASEDLFEGEAGIIISQGLVRYDQWSWSADKINRPVFCGFNGELTTTPPTRGVLQQVGKIYDTDAIYVNIFPSITLDHPDGVFVPPAQPPAGAPVVNFGTIGPRTGTAPLTVSFVNASTGGPFTLTEWDFTNDGTVDSTNPAPTYTFSTPGSYDVRLKAVNAAGAAQHIETGYVIVQDPLPAPGNTNLKVTFIVNGQSDEQPISVQRGSEFQVKVSCTNVGSLTATNVQRIFIVHDVGNQQVTVITPPAGAQVARGTGFTQIIFAPVAGMITGSSVDYPPFTLRAPNLAQPIRFEAAVSSPEVDADASDNSRALTIEVTA